MSAADSFHGRLEADVATQVDNLLVELQLLRDKLLEGREPDLLP